MKTRHSQPSTLTLAIFCAIGLAFAAMPKFTRADDQESTKKTMTSLFEFAKLDDASQWQIVNDGVMGGRSSSQAKVTDAGHMVFAGNLSLENNGGFASVRSRPVQGGQSLGLEPGGKIAIRVLGDGRRYTFNLYTPDRRTAFSYQLEFDTKAGEWLEIQMPIDSFVAHSFGRRLSGMRLDARSVQSIGILLGDKKPGSFELTIDWIRLVPAN